MDPVGTTKTKATEHETPDGFWATNVAEDVRRTDLGLLLFITSNILGIIGGFLIFYRSFDYLWVFGYVHLIWSGFGTLLIVWGSKAFGPRHSTYTILSLSIIVIMNLLSVTGEFTFIFSNLASALPATSLIVVLGAVGNIPGVLVTYELQATRGRILLFIAYAASLAWSITLAYESVTGPFGPLAGPISIPLGLTPAGIFTLASYLAYVRLRRREIPIYVPAARSLSESMPS